jgi:hypothetical protein
MSQETMTFWVRSRGKVGKARKVEIHQLNRDVFVPLSISVLELAPQDKTPPDAMHTDLLTVPTWWARKNLQDLLAKLAAGPVRRAPGLFRVKPAEPVHRNGVGAAFVDYADGTGSFVELRGQPVYLETNVSHDFNFARRAADLSLGEAARLLGLTPSEVSGLESGSHTFIDPEMWTKAMEALDAEGQRRRPKSATGENDDGRRKH